MSQYHAFLAKVDEECDYCLVLHKDGRIIWENSQDVAYPLEHDEALRQQAEKLLRDLSGAGGSDLAVWEAWAFAALEQNSYIPLQSSSQLALPVPLAFGGVLSGLHLADYLGSQIATPAAFVEYEVSFDGQQWLEFD